MNTLIRSCPPSCFSPTWSASGLASAPDVPGWGALATFACDSESWKRASVKAQISTQQAPDGPTTHQAPPLPLAGRPVLHAYEKKQPMASHLQSNGSHWPSSLTWSACFAPAMLEPLQSCNLKPKSSLLGSRAGAARRHKSNTCFLAEILGLLVNAGYHAVSKDQQSSKVRSSSVVCPPSLPSLPPTSPNCPDLSPLWLFLLHFALLLPSPRDPPLHLPPLSPPQLLHGKPGRPKPTDTDSE